MRRWQPRDPSGLLLTRRAVLLGSAALAAGCAFAPGPPLEELYRQTATSPTQPPLIVIPGAFGSVLRDAATGREIWPGSNLDLLLGSYRRLAVAFDEESLEPLPGAVSADGVFTDRLGQDFYGAILHTLERVGGFRRCTPGQPPDRSRRNYYVLVYDWRLDNSISARRLHALIESIRADHADPTLRVDILAHSNGGLLGRYYARYGTADLEAASPARPSCEGAAAIRRLLIVGTPNLGTLQPVLALVRGEELPLRKIAPEIVATCCGAPQLMPHPAVPWLADVRGRSVTRGVFEIDTWRELRWCIFDPDVRERTIATHGGGAAGRRYLEGLERYFARHLARARLFMTRLAEPAPEADVRPFVFGGDCAETPALLVAENIRGAIRARENPAAIEAPEPGVDYRALMFEPGDLVVTRSSLLGSVARGAALTGAAPAPLRITQSVFLCEEHRSLTANSSFQDNLLNTLLSEAQ